MTFLNILKLLNLSNKKLKSFLFLLANSNDNNSSLMLNMKNQCIQSNNSIDDYSYLWNNQFNDTNKPNSHIYDNSCLNNNGNTFFNYFLKTFLFKKQILKILFLRIMQLVQ